MYISENQLSILERDWKPEKLTYLNISGNELFELENLNDLEISENQLSSIPKEIGNLKNLTHLDISENRVSELPEELFELKNLELLDISENQLEKLSSALNLLPNLEFIAITSSPQLAKSELISNLKAKRIEVYNVLELNRDFKNLAPQ